VQPLASGARERTFGEERIRCVLVHDHILLRQGLQRLLADEPDVEVVAEAGNATAALRRVFEHRPDVVIVGASIFGGAIDEVERLIRHESPPSRVLLLTMDEECLGPRDDGAEGTSCAVRETSAQELVEAIRKIHSPRNAVREMPRKARVPWPADAHTSRNRTLTSRESEVLKLLAEGRTVRSVAVLLGLSVKTVDAHKFNLMRKLGIHNKAELVMWAIRKKVVQVPANF
jgi:two-component system, NarL family, response regulator NreC